MEIVGVLIGVVEVVRVVEIGVVLVEIVVVGIEGGVTEVVVIGVVVVVRGEGSSSSNGVSIYKSRNGRSSDSSYSIISIGISSCSNSRW